MASILTQPIAQSTIPGIISQGIIPNNTTLTVDAININTVNTVKWIVELIDNTNFKMLSFEILGINKFNSNTSHNKYGITGENILHGVTVIINGSDINLDITNNESVDLNYKIARIQL